MDRGQVARRDDGGSRTDRSDAVERAAAVPPVPRTRRARLRADAAERRVPLLGGADRRDAAELLGRRTRRHGRRRRHDRRHLRILLDQAGLRSCGLRRMKSSPRKSPPARGGEVSMDMSAFAARLAEVGAEVEAELEELLALGPRPPRARAARASARRDAPWRAGRGQTAAALPDDRDRAGARRCRRGAAARGRGDRMRALLFAHPRRSAGDGRRRSSARPARRCIRAFDEATAILAGDALLTLAFEVMADPATHPDGATRAALCVGLARASGLGGMVGGQMLDIAAESATAAVRAPTRSSCCRR